MNDRKSLKGHVLSMLCVIAWGTSFLVSKNLMGRLTPVQLMLLRFVIAWLAIWVIYPKWHFNWREEGPFCVLSLVGNTLYYLAENTALRLTLASNVSILVSAAPIISAGRNGASASNMRSSRASTTRPGRRKSWLPSCAGPMDI